MSHSIRLGLVLLFTATMALVLLAIGAFVAAGFRHERDGAIDAELRARAAAVLAAGPQSPRPETVTLLGTTDEHFGQILGRDGSVLVTSAALRPVPIIAPDPAGLRTTYVQTRAERRHVRVLVDRSAARTIVVVSALDDRDDAMRHLVILLWLGGAATLVAASILAWLLAGASLRPVERMRAEAAGYSASDLRGRLDVPRTGDELRQLAETLNAMLDRIQGRFDEQRTFIDRASHELRTPLANLTMELELAMRHQRSETELREVVASLAQEIHRLNRLASDLLMLSRASDGEMRLQVERIDLTALVGDTVASFRARAEAAEVSLETDLPAVEPLLADEDLLRRALTNLLDNALRVSPTGGSVTISLAATADTATMTVTDDGTGFSPELRAHAFDLFARGAGPRRADDGPGLGLSVVAAVAQAHGGRASIDEDGPHTAVSLSIPRR
ncbi:ATP-binding protein [Aquihabitans sp. McL0605]|uniref:ATP-binding protein n=1 Tax=Aquihabitans sp. McL0605 TaxID=3415671 RepID=UPI003CEAF68F